MRQKKAGTMQYALLSLLLTVLLGVHCQTGDVHDSSDQQAPPLFPPPGEAGSPALVAADPGLVQAIVQGVVSEVGAVTAQGQLAVHVTPELVQTIVQKVLHNLAVGLNQQEPESDNTDTAAVNSDDTGGTDRSDPQGPPAPLQPAPPFRVGGDQSGASLRKDEICRQPPMTGMCRGYVPSFHYNVTEGRCHQFIFGGCGGNQNRFESEEECRRFCAP